MLRKFVILTLFCSQAARAETATEKSVIPDLRAEVDRYVTASQSQSEAMGKLSFTLTMLVLNKINLKATQVLDHFNLVVGDENSTEDDLTAATTSLEKITEALTEAIKLARTASIQSEAYTGVFDTALLEEESKPTLKALVEKAQRQPDCESLTQDCLKAQIEAEQMELRFRDRLAKTRAAK